MVKGINGIWHGINLGQAAVGAFSWMGSGGLLTEAQKSLVNRVVAVEVGDACTKRCLHCIYADKTKSLKEGAPKRWVTDLQCRALNHVEPRVVSLAAREAVLFPEASIPLLKASSAEIKVLMTSLPIAIGMREVEIIQHLTHVDVSLDGDEVFHNQLRGNRRSFGETMERAAQIQALDMVEVSHIATPCGDESIAAIIRMANIMPAGRVYTMSLYYGFPDDPMLLSLMQLVRLASGLSESSLGRAIIPWTNNYAHLWPSFRKEMGLRNEDIRYCADTGMAVLRFGNVDFLLFHLSSGWESYRLSHEGDIFSGCNHLVLGSGAKKYALGRLNDTGTLPPQHTYMLSKKCVECPDFGECGGGDMLSGSYFGTGHDPFCRFLN